MKVLFVSSGNNLNKDVPPIIKSQGDSLSREGVDMDYYIIEGSGVSGYFKNIARLRKKLKKQPFDLIHAHYGLSAIIAYFAKRKQRLVVSFMGDDLVGSNNEDGSISTFSKVLIAINKVFAKYLFDYNIVKSSEMAKVLNLEKVEVIPNGVDFDRFYELDRSQARTRLSLDPDKKIALFCANPKRFEKNYKLAKAAVDHINDENYTLLCIHGIDQNELVYYYNASNCLVLTSFHEGSPNVVKEAMASNMAVVSTNVGDVSEVITGVEGSYIVDYNVQEVASKIIASCSLSGRIDGRSKIGHLESSVIAKKIINIYNKVLEN